MQQSNVFILSERFAELEQAFLNDARIGLVQAARNVPFWISDTVDFLLIDGWKMLLRAQNLIVKIRDAAIVFPRIFYLEDRLDNALFHSLHKYIDLTCSAMVSEQEIVDLTISLWNTPFPALADVSKRREAACDLLDEMRMPCTLKGYRCIAEGAALMSCTFRHDAPMKTWLYIHVANAVNSKPELVERNIRTAIENTFLYGDMYSIQKRFGYTFDAEKGKPTNAEMLCMLAEHIKNRFRFPEY